MDIAIAANLHRIQTLVMNHLGPKAGPINGKNDGKANINKLHPYQSLGKPIVMPITNGFIANGLIDMVRCGIGDIGK